MKKIYFALMLAMLCSGLSAQNLSKTGVVKMNIRSTGPIIQNEQIKGYYLFYLVEKQDKKNYNYLLSIYDENLREINSVTLTRPRTFFLIEGGFNGEAFGFLFYDTKSKSVELIGYDRSLKQTGVVKKIVSNKFLIETYKNFAIGQEPSQAYLVPVSNKGFLYYGLKEGKKAHYHMEFFDNSMKSLWSEQVKEKNGYSVETASEAFQSEEFVGTLITKRKLAASTNPETELAIHETLTGKLLFRVPMMTDKYTVSFSEISYDPNASNFTVFGEYFNKDGNEAKDRSLGFITLTFDMNGKIAGVKTNSWLNEISKAAPVNERGKFDGNNTSILFHNIVRTNDGKIFVIGEQYKKAASAAGIMMNVLAAAGGGYSQASNVQLNVYNMVIFEFTSDYVLKKVHVFEKDKNVLQLPAGYGALSPRSLSYFAKAVGGFDYSFTQPSSDKSTFYVSYVNYDREKGEKGKNVLGTIVYTPEKVFSVDKLPMNRKSTLYFVYRAKEGYVMITEYFKKEKRLDTRLEKVNY
jgi:hypothetical protein